MSERTHTIITACITAAIVSFSFNANVTAWGMT